MSAARARLLLSGAGWIQTDGGNKSAVKLGLKQAPVALADCVPRVVALLDTATRESHGGKFWSTDADKELPW